MGHCYGSVDQSAESTDLKSVKCGFESHYSYLSPGDGTGIRAWLRTTILGVRLPSGRLFIIELHMLVYALSC